MTNSKDDWFACSFTITINPNAPLQVDPPQRSNLGTVVFVFMLTTLRNNSNKQLVVAVATVAMVALPTNTYS